MHFAELDFFLQFKRNKKNRLHPLQKNLKRRILISLMNLDAHKKILVVEDDGDIRSLLETALILEGYQVETAINGQDALETLRKSVDKPNLIVLDLMMPVMDGWRFLEIQSQVVELKNIPTIIVSATSQKKMPEPSSTQVVLKKPIDLGEFLNHIEAFIHA